MQQARTRLSANSPSTVTPQLPVLFFGHLRQPRFRADSAVLSNCHNDGNTCPDTFTKCWLYDYVPTNNGNGDAKYSWYATRCPVFVVARMPNANSVQPCRVSALQLGIGKILVTELLRQLRTAAQCTEQLIRQIRGIAGADKG